MDLHVCRILFIVIHSVIGACRKPYSPLFNVFFLCFANVGIQDIVGVLRLNRSRKKNLQILNDVSGILKPTR